MPAKKENSQVAKPLSVLRKCFAWIDLLSDDGAATVWIQTSEYFLSQLIREAPRQNAMKHGRRSKLAGLLTRLSMDYEQFRRACEKS